MLQNLRHARRVLFSGLLASGLILGLTTGAESQSSKAKPKKPEKMEKSSGAPSPSPTSSPAAAKAPDAQPPGKGQFDENLWSGMKWREVGPFRGGRAVAIEGVSGEPNVYYFGGVAGGVWKTADGGANWKPMFDKQHSTSSIGAIAVA